MVVVVSKTLSYQCHAHTIVNSAHFSHSAVSGHTESTFTGSRWMVAQLIYSIPSYRPLLYVVMVCWSATSNSVLIECHMSPLYLSAAVCQRSSSRLWLRITGGDKSTHRRASTLACLKYTRSPTMRKTSVLYHDSFFLSDSGSLIIS